MPTLCAMRTADHADLARSVTFLRVSKSSGRGGWLRRTAERASSAAEFIIDIVIQYLEDGTHGRSISSGWRDALLEMAQLRPAGEVPVSCIWAEPECHPTRA